jgi:type III restriction enzyme
MQEGYFDVESQRQNLKIKNDIYTNAVYDIVGEIESLTNLKRSTIVAILKAIKEEKFLLTSQKPGGVYC